MSEEEKAEFRRYLEEIYDEADAPIQKAWEVFGYMVWILIILIVLFV